MRTIERTGQFKRDYRRALKGSHREMLEEDFITVVGTLVADRPLPEKNHDHELIGNWKDFRDCHSKPDLVLIYRKLEPEGLQLVRLGSHSELGI